MTNSQTEREQRAKEEGVKEGKIIQAVADLKETVNLGFQNVKEEFNKGSLRFNNLPCKENSKAIEAMNFFIEKENKKKEKWNKRKKMLITMLIKKILPSMGVSALLAASAAIAYFQG